MTSPIDENDIPRKVWVILLSWGVAVLLLAGLFSYWTWNNQRRVAADREGALCALISIFLTGPEPVQGPAGDRSRSVRDGMKNYQNVLECKDFARPS